MTDDGQRIICTWNRLVYRSPQGWRAFPDGGVPLYQVDEQIIGLYDLSTPTMRVLHRETNKEWVPGQGSFAVRQVCGARVFITQGGQDRDTRHYRSRLKEYWLDVQTGVLTPLPLAEEVTARGFAAGYWLLLAPDGTLLYVAQSADRNAGEELWLRTPTGGYHRLATGSYYGCADGEVHYWNAGNRQYRLYSLARQTDRQGSPADQQRLPINKAEGYCQDVTVDAHASMDGKLEIARKVNGQWQAWEPVPVTVAELP